MNTFNNPNAANELQNLETRESNRTTNIVIIVSALIFLAAIGGIFYFMQQQNIMNMQQQNAQNAMTMQQRENENLPTQTYESRTIERNNTTTENATPATVHIITQPAAAAVDVAPTQESTPTTPETP